MKQESHLVQTRIEQSSHHQQLVQLQKLKDDIKQRTGQITEAKKVEQTATEHLREIQEKLSVSQIHVYYTHVHCCIYEVHDVCNMCVNY